MSHQTSASYLARWARMVSSWRRLSARTTNNARTAATPVATTPTSAIVLLRSMSSSEPLPWSPEPDAAKRNRVAIHAVHQAATSPDPDAVRHRGSPRGWLTSDPRHRSCTISTGITKLANGMNHPPIDQPGEKSYPICLLAYIIVQKDVAPVMDRARADALMDFLAWATTDGQKSAAELNYGPFGPAMTKKAAEAIQNVNYGADKVRENK